MLNSAPWRTTRGTPPGIFYSPGVIPGSNRLPPSNIKQNKWKAILQFRWKRIKPIEGGWLGNYPGLRESTKKILKRIQGEIIIALDRVRSEGLLDNSPQGGKIWPTRYFGRRTAWHILDHLREIEDRVV